MDIFTEKQVKLRKISPNKHLQNSLSIIYYLGCWSESAKYKYLYNIYTACSLIYLSGITMTSEVMYVILNWGNLELMMVAVPFVMTYSTYAAKIIYIIRHHKRIKDLIDITNTKMFNRDNDKYERIITYYTWQGIFHHIAYQSFGGIATISWGCTPILYLANKASKQLPMAGWFPYNVTSTPAFEITCLHQFIVILISCINNIAIDTLITGLIMTACCQLTLLSYNISSIHCTVEQEHTILSDNFGIGTFTLEVYNKLYEDLKHCVKHSIMIFDFSKQIQNIFGTLIFFQLLVNCIIVCLTAFNISQMKDYVPSELFGTLLYMCCMTYQIFIYCWHGNELYLHSRKICLSAYANNWWNNSKNFNHSLLIIMIRTQWPLIITVGNIMDLSLRNFVLMIKENVQSYTSLHITAYRSTSKLYLILQKYPSL